VAPRTSANGAAPDADGETPDRDGEAPSQAMRHYFYEGFSWFVAAYRTAAEKLQKGDPRPTLSPRELPAGVAVRRRVGRDRRGRILIGYLASSTFTG
jgi:hypothetical protein